MTIAVDMGRKATKTNKHTKDSYALFDVMFYAVWGAISLLFELMFQAYVVWGDCSCVV